MKSRQDFYTDEVFPHLPAVLKTQIQERYPNVSLSSQPGFTLLSEVPVLMLVALTATGKSTTLEQLAKMREVGQLHYRDDILTRRELADYVIIPTAQVIGGEDVKPVTGREERFEYTRKFAQEFEPGGSAAAYGWFYYRWDGKTPILSDGIRGPGEISYALAHYPAWRVLELWIDPLVRLQRLTNRADVFDQITNLNREIDLSFLPADAVDEAWRLIESGDISHKAILTVRAEAQNYGSEPFDKDNAMTGYHFLPMKNLPPQDVALEVIKFMQENDHAHHD
jgi:hypothetical protein